MARLRTIRATALTFVLVSGSVVALTSGGSSNALGNVIQITPTTSAIKSSDVRGSEPVVSNRGEIVSVVIRDDEPPAKPFDVAFVGAPAQDPPAGKQITDYPGFDIAVSGDGCVGVVTSVEGVFLVTGLCGDPAAVTKTVLVSTDHLPLTLSSPALSYDGHFLAVEAQLDKSDPYIARIDTTKGEIAPETVVERLRPMPVPTDDYGDPFWFPDAQHGLDISDAGDAIVATFERIDPPVEATGGSAGFDLAVDPGIGSDGGGTGTMDGGSGATPVPAPAPVPAPPDPPDKTDGTPDSVFVAAWHVVTEGDVSTDLSTIVSGDAAAAFPSLSGDGRFVSYTSLDEPSSDLYDEPRGPWTYVREVLLSADAEGPVLDLGKPVLVSDPDAFAMYTSLSRDGTQLAYATMEHECDDDANGGNVSVLGQRRCRPDRIHVAYGNDPGFTGPFADETVVETEVGVNAEPALSGNGRWIAWRSTAGDELLGDNDFSHNEHVFMRSRDARLTVDAVDFGEVARDSSAIGMATVRNEGTTTASIDDVSSAATPFVVVSGGTCVVGATLPPGGSCTIAVQFSSSGLEGEITGSLHVREVGYEPLTTSGPLRARVAPAPVLDPPTQPTEPTIPPTDPPPSTEPTIPPTDPPPPAEPTAAALQATPNPIDFGIVPVGITSAGPSVVTVQNVGNAAGVPAVALGGEHAGDFRIVSDTCSATELAPAAVCTVEVVTQPTGGGPRTAALSVRVDADALDVGLLAEAHYMPRLLTAPVTVTERGITMIVGQGFPPLEDVDIAVGSTGIVVRATADESGRFRIPFSPLGKLPLGSHVVGVAGRPLVYDSVETPLVVVLSTFEPQGSSGPLFGSNVIVARSS